MTSLDNDLWVFGYGSLIFRADFPFEEKVPATINHWTRRFWQGSTDHRGTEVFPGRVVTLHPAPNQTCWGLAYRIAAANVDSVLDHLDYREKGGYERLEIPMHLSDKRVLSGITYYANTGNENYLGDAALSDMLLQIQKAVGPSGPNKEYLLLLEKSLEEYGVSDPHVSALADGLRALYA